MPALLDFPPDQWETSAGECLPWQLCFKGREEASPKAVFLICYSCAQESTFLGCCLSKRLSSMEVIPALLLIEVLLQLIWDPQKIKTIPPSWSSARRR